MFSKSGFCSVLVFTYYLRSILSITCVFANSIFFRVSEIIKVMILNMEHI